MNLQFRTPVRAAALSVAASVALAAAACGYVRPPALTLSRDASSDPLFTLTADELFAELGKQQGSAALGGTTTSPASFEASQIAELLTAKVRPRILGQLLAERNLSATEQDRAAVEQAASQQQQQPTAEELEYQADNVVLARTLSDDFFSRPGNNIEEYARTYYEQRKNAFAVPAQSCIHVITVDAGDGQTAPTDAQYAETLPQAQTLRQRLNSEPWEKVFEASGRSTQGIPGGDLGCRSNENLPSELVEAFASVPPGSTSEPLKWRAGWAIVRVDDRKEARTPPFDEVKQQAIVATRSTFGQQFVNELLGRAYKSFVVTVDPRFGRWDAQAGQVLTPDGAAVPTTPTTSTTQPTLDGGAPPATAPPSAG